LFVAAIAAIVAVVVVFGSQNTFCAYIPFVLCTFSLFDEKTVCSFLIWLLIRDNSGLSGLGK
jgi:uncharacterized membrane protein